MPVLKDGDGNIIEEGYYNKVYMSNLRYIHKRNGFWFESSTRGGLVMLYQDTSKNFYRCHDQKQSKRDFVEISESLRKNIERIALGG